MNGTFNLDFQAVGSSNVARIRLIRGRNDNFVYGGVIDRECRVNQPGWTVAWQYPNRTVINTPYLYISDLTQRHAGRYRCIATKAGRRIQMSFEIEFEEEVEVSRTSFATVEITIRPRIPETLEIGGSVHRLCTTNGPGWRVQWRTPRGRVIQDGQLDLSNLSGNEMGEYICTARRGNEEVQSYLLLMQSDRRVEVKTLSLQTVSGEQLRIGGTLYKRCVAPGPGWRAFWRLPGGRIVNGEVLRVDGLSARNEGLYECAVQGPSNAQLRLFFRLKLQRTGTVDDTRAERARITIRRLQGDNPVFGGTIRRECVVDQPGWQAAWFHPNGVRDARPVLYLSGLSERNSGNYRCIATKGSSRLDISFDVEFRRPQDNGAGRARISLNPLPGENFVSGGAILRECRVDQPGWEVLWRFPDGRVINQPTLRITGLSERDAGTYRCVARKGNTRLQVEFTIEFRDGGNRGGTDSSAAQIRVQPLPGDNMVPGGTVRRECRVDQPGWTIRWELPDARTIDQSILRIDNLSERDAGRYRCVAENGQSRLQLSFDIRFQRSETTTSLARISLRRLQGDNFVFGGTVYRECRVNQDGWDIKWEYPDGRVINRANLYINNLSEREAGIYRCVATKNGVRLHISFEIRFQRQPPPSQRDVSTVEITIRPRIPETLRMGGSIHRLCAATGPGWRVSWRTPRGQLVQGGQLDLSNIGAGEMGEYVCTARKSGEEIQSYLLLIRNDQRIVARTLVLETVSGEQLKMGGALYKRCVPPSRDWRTYWQLPGGRTVDGEYLRVDNLSARDAGLYVCTAEGPSSQRLRLYFRLSVQASSEPATPVAEINIKTLDGESMEYSGSVRRQCEINAPGWNMFWTTPNGTRIDSPYLLLNNLKVSDNGQYTCHARHPSTGATMSAWFSVFVTDGGYTNVDINVLPGENLVLGGQVRRECVVTSQYWRVYWSKPDGLRVDGPFLRVDNLRPQDSGRYTCHARNSISGRTASSWFSLDIRGRSTLKINTLRDESLVIGGRIRRRCVASSPGWQIYWMKPNGERVNDAVLEVVDLKQSDSGRYTCYARQQATGSTMEAWFTFSLLSVATLQMDTMPDEDLRLGGILSQRCRIDAAGWTIHWTLPNGSRVNTDHLRVPNLSLRDYGRYWCIARKASTGEERKAWYQLG